MNWLAAFGFRQYMVTLTKRKLGVTGVSRHNVWHALVQVASQHPDEKVAKWILDANWRLGQ